MLRPEDRVDAPSPEEIPAWAWEIHKELEKNKMSPEEFKNIFGEKS